MKTNKMTCYAFSIIRRIYLSKGSIVTAIYISEKEHISYGVVMKILTTLKVADVIASHWDHGDV